MSKHPDMKRYVAIGLDPVYIGAGGYRLGRVDNTIVRDPATNVPKIPGTSLAGVIRAYAKVVKEESDSFKDIEIEETFGTANGGGRQSILRFYDGEILFFPVSSIQGVVWITTKELLEYWVGEIKDKEGEQLKIPDITGDEIYPILAVDNLKPLNLGWLMLEIKNKAEKKQAVLPSSLKKLVKRIVVVSDKLFSHIVNDNLEVRTSVRIDSTRGTAEPGALFTYEAMPRGAIYCFEIVINKRRCKEDNVVSLVEATFPYLKLLGIGGMGTRGFGRIEVRDLKKRKNN